MMQNFPFVSILINNYNYGQFLRDAIESALAQSYENCEVIVVDDGSTDDSRVVIDEYGDRIISLLQSNSGQATAFNNGFLRSRGDIVCFLDSDDLFEPVKVESVVRSLEKYPSAQWCFHPMLMVDQDNQELSNCREKFTGESGYYDLTASMRFGRLSAALPFKGTATSGLCFKRDFLSRLLPISEAMRIEGGQTSDNYLKYAAFGLVPGSIVLEYLTRQRVHDRNSYTMKDNISDVRLDIDVMTAYWLRKNFPQLSLFAHNIFLFSLLKNRHAVNVNPKVTKLIEEYQETLSLFDRIFINVKKAYFYFKL